MEQDWLHFIKSKHTDYKRLGQISCPAFDDEKVFFTSAGFRHLIRKNGVLRSKDQQKRRLDLLAQVPYILSAAMNHTTYHKNKSTLVQFWSFTSKIFGKTVTVIIRQVNKNPKHFLSVFDEDSPESAQTP
jgi:hypothetical protein